MKLVLAISIALAMATPALAFNVEWHGDLNNRFSYSNQADTSIRISKDDEKYIGAGGAFLALDSLPAADFKKQTNDSDFFGELKYRMHLVASDDEKKVNGVVGFEFGSRKYGQSGADFGGDDNVFELRWAYTDIELPFDSASRLIVGLQPVGYNAFVWSDNAGGVKWKRTEGNLAYSLGWFRNDFTGTLGSDDKSRYDDAYAADMTYVFDSGSALNAFVIYMDQGQDRLENLLTGVEVSTDVQDEEIWLGLAGTGKWGNLSGMFNAIYLTGEAKIDGESLDRSAYLLQAQGDYKMDKFTFTLGGLYASGDDDNADGDIENFDHIDIGTGILGSVVIFDNFADDNSPSQAFYVTDQGYKIIYLGVNYALTDKTDVWGKYFWHNTAEDELLGDDEIGHEFVLGASYKIMKGLTAAINGGYLVAGDALDALSTDTDADDIFRTDASLQFKF